MFWAFGDTGSDAGNFVEEDVGFDGDRRIRGVCVVDESDDAVERGDEGIVLPQ